MGFLDWLRGTPQITATESHPAAEQAQAPLHEVGESLRRFDPSSPVRATEPWAQKLVTYGKRVNKELERAGVDGWPGHDFRLIAADVHEATWHVPVTNKFSQQQGWMREGLCSGSALLLLTSSGRLVKASFHGHFNFDEHHLSFEYENSDIDDWRTYSWGANNYASWRDKGRSFPRFPQAKYQEFWDGRWNYRGIEEKPPGLGTSLALKRFSETRKTQLPKHY